MHTFSTFLPDEAATAAFGAALAPCLQPGLAIYLHGDLGAGKTALTRALIHACGYTGSVKSPTYTLVEHYRLPQRSLQVVHFDLYRMGSPEEFLDAGLREEFNPENVCIVEWPEQGAGVLPAPDWEIHLRLAGSGRALECRALSEQGALCLKLLHFAPIL